MSDSAVADPEVGASIPEPPEPAAENPVRPDAGPLPRPFGLLLALVSGLVLTLAFPGAGNLWPLAPVAVAGLALATRGQRTRFAAGLGYLFGLGFFVPHLHWSGIYVGALPWFALAGAEAAFLAALGALLPRIWRVPGGAAGMALAGAGLWVGQEALRDRLPFGGFPWGRLAFSQAEAPTVGLAALGGAPLVTAAVAAAGGLLAWAVLGGWQVLGDRRVLGRRAGLRWASSAQGSKSGAGQGHEPGTGRGTEPGLGRSPLRAHLSAGLALVAALAVLAVGLLVPRPTDGPTARVAAVQGNVPEAGLEFNAERRAVLDNHVRGTLKLAERVRAGTAKAPDLVIWPENSSDIDPLRNPDAAAVIAQAVTAIKVPILVGAVLEEPVGKLSNASLVWNPGTGPGARYVKRHPAPFAEYIPYRSFFRHFSTKVDLVQKDFVSGDTLRKNPVGVLSMGPARVGDVICFEVAYDRLVRDPVRQGATILAVQTNNATFGFTAESVQQLAMSQLRAVETGRTVVHISTVGVSAIIRPDGTVQHRSGHFTPEVLEADVPLRTSLTVATRVGGWPEGILALLGVGLLVAGGFIRRRELTKDPVMTTTLHPQPQEA